MKNNNIQFGGLGVALITPMHEDGSIDFQSLKKLVDHVVEGGTDYLVVLGSTGETSTISKEEQRAILDTVIAQNDKRIPIVLGSLAGNNTQEMVSTISSYDFTGVDGILIASPSYVKPTQEGLYQHYKAISEVSPLPILLYNVPSRTSCHISSNTTIRLAKECKNIVGIKDASSDMRLANRMIKHAPKDFAILSGDDETGVGLLAYGGHGIISVIGNIYPKEWTQIIHGALEGDYRTVVRLNSAMYDIHNLLYVEGNPTGIKSAAQIKGICGNHLRLPLRPLSPSVYTELEKTMEEAEKEMGH